jgi:hypothetical protein
VICKRLRRETSRQVLAIDSWHRFLWSWGISRRVTVENRVKCLWWLHSCLMCTIRYSRTLWTSTPEWSFRHQRVVLFFYVFIQTSDLLKLANCAECDCIIIKTREMMTKGNHVNWQAWLCTFLVKLIPWSTELFRNEQDRYLNCLLVTWIYPFNIMQYSEEPCAEFVDTRNESCLCSS